MQAIIITADAEEREFLSFVLRHAGLSVARTAESQHATSVLREHPVDLILLGLNARTADLSDVAEIRSKTQAPLLLLVERLTEEEHCQLLDAGADMVLERPVSPRILTRYTRMLLRRAGTVPASILPAIEIGDLSLDPTTRMVRQIGSEPHPLAPLEFRLLYLLMTNPEWVIPVDTIVERVWGYSGTGNRDLVRGLVRRLRRKIEPQPGKHTYIHNVPSVGYRFVSRPVDS